MERDPPHLTGLAAGQITNTETITVELVEAYEPAVVIISWPSKPSVIHPHRFPGDGGPGGEIVCPSCHPARSDQADRKASQVTDHLGRRRNTWPGLMMFGFGPMTSRLSS
jgi:hypothetical protein